MLFLKFVKQRRRVFFAPFSSLTNFFSIPIKSRSSHQFFLQPSSGISIPHSKTNVYASLFCSLIHLFLSCGHPSRASQAFTFMRSNGVAPSSLRSWNHLLRDFHNFGMVYQVLVAYLKWFPYPLHNLWLPAGVSRSYVTS